MELNFNRVSEDDIQVFLKGIGPLKDIKHIRQIECNNWSPVATIFIREKDEEKSKMRTYKYRPFIYTKKLDFSDFYVYDYIEVGYNQMCENREKFPYKDSVLSVNDDIVEDLGESDNARGRIFKIYLEDIKNRVKLFHKKIEEYNITYNELQGDTSVERLANGYSFVFHIEPPKSRHEVSSNPLYKKKGEKERKIRGSYKDLLNFFAEGGLNVYERRGVFLNNEKVESFAGNSDEKEKLLLYVRTMELFKSSKDGLDITGFFNNVPSEDYFLQIAKQNFHRRISEFLHDNLVRVHKKTENKSYQYIVGSSESECFLNEGAYGQLHLLPYQKDELVENQYEFLRGYKYINDDWEGVKNYIQPFINDVKEIIVEGHYGDVYIDKAYEQIFGSNYDDFVLYLRDELSKLKNKRKPTAKLSKAKICLYMDIVGHETFFDGVNFEGLDLEINTDFVKELNKDGRRNAFSLGSTITGRKTIAVFERYGYDFLDTVESKFFTMTTETQFMIQSGARLYRDTEFSDLNILTFDIETRALPEFEWNAKAALSPEMGCIFQIGISTTKGFSKVLHADNQEEELQIIKDTYEIIRDLDPDVVLGYNSEHFDFPFVQRRYEILSGAENTEFAEDDIRGLVFDESLGVMKWYGYNRRLATLKVGGATEKYTQTNLYGKAVLDGIHQTKKLQAMDKRDYTSLKWNVKYENIAKKNRVYVDGNKIGEIGKDEREYFFCDENGDYFVNSIPIETQNPIFKKEDIERDENGILYYKNKNYLYINTENGQDNEIKNCSNLITYKKGKLDIFENSLYNAIKDYSKLIIPEKRFGTEYVGTGHFNDIKKMLFRIKDNFSHLNRVYSHLDFEKYEKVSGKYIVERYLLDDLWETVKLFEKTGQSSFMLGKWVMIGPQRVYTMGYASMWKIILTCWFYHNNLVIPDYEGYRKINGGLIGMFEAGFCKNEVKIDASSLYPAVYLAYLEPPEYDKTGITYSLLRFFLNTRLKYKALKSKYAKEGDYAKSKLYAILEQPLKIFINSFYGFLGAWTVSMFSDTTTAHGITAVSRQIARHLIKYGQKKDLKPIYSHTDGINFMFPDDVKNETYIGLGNNWLVEKGKTYSGIEAVVAKYNDEYMVDKMGMDIDGIYESCINLGKSNVIHLKKNKDSTYKTEIVGGIIKKDTKKYIVRFLDDNLIDFMKGKSKKYVKNLIDYLLKIKSRDLKGEDIADFRKVKSLVEYKNEYKRKVAVYEYLKHTNLKYEVGALFHYYNNGDMDEDMKNQKDKIGAFKVDSLNAAQRRSLKKYLKEFKNPKELAQRIIKANEMGMFIFSKKRCTLNDIKPHNEEFYNVQKQLHDVDDKRLYEKVFMLNDIENWDGLSISSETHDKHGLLFVVNKEEHILNIKHLPKEELSNKIDYNVHKYINLFFKAVSQIHVCFSKHDRLFLEQIKNAILDYGEDWYKHVSKELKTKTELYDYIDKHAFNLVSGIPNKEDSQQDLNKILEIENVEYSYWNQTMKSPYWFMDKNYIDPEINYIDDTLTVHQNIDDVEGPIFAQCDSYGTILHYSKNNFVEHGF